VNLPIYARVSTEDQNLKQAIKVLKKHCGNKRYGIQKVYKDKESGTLFSRKGFQSLLKACRQGKHQSILVYSIDRLTRNFFDGVKIEKFLVQYKIQLYTISGKVDLSSAMGRAKFRMELIFSAHMVEDMKERQKIGIQRAQNEGKYKGGKKGRTWKNRKEVKT
jgi:DNA invertase Pin-like site-specific DNA recombinase